MKTGNHKTVCAINTCTGCNACVNACPHNAISLVDSLTSLNAVVDTTKCVNCNACSRVCQGIVPSNFTKPLAFFQGWNNHDEVRLNSSSGGFIASVVHEFIENDEPVFGCIFENGTFVFRRVKSMSAFAAFSGSKYVKSDTGSIYKDVLNELKNNKKTLFIGLPCQVQGLKLFVGKTYWDNLYTIDLICHGSPSAGLFEIYLKECGYDVSTIKYISFRNKNRYSNKKTDKYQYWLSPFLDGLTYTDNCYSCRFARLERVSDFTAGDSWGSSLPTDELCKGVSLVLCNSEKGLDLIDHIDFHKEAVDPIKAASNNEQLVRPMSIPKKRIVFKHELKTAGYHKAIRRCYRKQIIRRFIGRTFIGKIVKYLLKKRDAESQVDISFSEYFIFDK